MEPESSLVSIDCSSDIIVIHFAGHNRLAASCLSTVHLVLTPRPGVSYISHVAAGYIITDSTPVKCFGMLKQGGWKAVYTADFISGPGSKG